jgi:predicted dinucleotide-binding enzyme
MRFAVIGSGNVGSAIGRAAQRTGHDVIIASDSPEHAAALGDSLGVQTTPSLVDAVAGADAVVLAVPFAAFPDVGGQIAEAVAGKIVVDVSNPVREDLSDLATTVVSAAEMVQQLLPDAKVVKAFNTVFAANQDTGEVDGIQLDGFVAADDPDAKRSILDFLEEIGYRPIDAGPLAAARHLEAMAFLNMWLNATNGWSWQTGWKLVGPTS